MNEREKRQNLITKVHLMIKEVNQMSKGKKRLSLLQQIDALLSYLYYTDSISLNEYDGLLRKIKENDLLSLRYKLNNDVYRELFNDNELLSMAYQDYLQGFTDVRDKIYNSIIDYEKVWEIFIEFLKKINCYNLYQEIKNKEMLKTGCKKASINVMQDGLCFNNKELSYMVLGHLDKNSFEYFQGLVHLMGHAYVNEIIKKDKQSIDNSKVYNEIIPLLFEKMFIDYLSQNHILDNNKIQSVTYNRERVHYDNMIIACEITKLISKKVWHINHLNSQQYEEIIHSIDPNITIFIHHYVIGYIISNKLFSEYKRNEEEFMKELPYMISDLEKLSVKELLQKYVIEQEKEKQMKKV